MPNKYYLRSDRMAVTKEQYDRVKSERPNPGLYEDLLKYYDDFREWDQKLSDLPALDVDPDYLKRLSPGWFEGEEQYEVLNIINGKWESRNHNVYANNELKLRRILIVAPQEATNFYCVEFERNGYTCEQQCSKCKKAEDMPQEEEQYDEPVRDDFWIMNEPGQLPATPQPVTGEAKIFSREISKHLVMISRISDLDQMRRKVFDLVSLIANHFIPMEESQAASRPSDAVEFGDLIEDAVNAYFHQAEKELGRKDLGYIEERNWQKIKNDCQRFFANSKSLNPNK